MSKQFLAGRTPPVPRDANGNIIAQVLHRTGTLDQLYQITDAGAGEIAVPTDVGGALVGYDNNISPFIIGEAITETRFDKLSGITSGVDFILEVNPSVVTPGYGWSDVNDEFTLPAYVDGPNSLVSLRGICAIGGSSDMTDWTVKMQYEFGGSWFDFVTIIDVSGSVIQTFPYPNNGGQFDYFFTIPKSFGNSTRFRLVGNVTFSTGTPQVQPSNGDCKLFMKFVTLKKS